TSLLHVFTMPRTLAPGDSALIGFSYTGEERGATKNGGGAMEFLLPSGLVMTSFGAHWFPVVGYIEEIGVKRDKNDYEPRQYGDDFYEGITEPLFGSQLPMTTRIAITAPAEFTVNSVGEQVS